MGALREYARSLTQVIHPQGRLGNETAHSQVKTKAHGVPYTAQSTDVINADLSPACLTPKPRLQVTKFKARESLLNIKNVTASCVIFILCLIPFDGEKYV